MCDCDLERNGAFHRDGAALNLHFRVTAGQSMAALAGKLEDMQLHLLKSKIHRAEVTGASVDYEGSLTIAADLMERVGLLPFERILCSNLANGARFETYAIPGDWGSGAIVLNGATAHLGKPGDRITIMSYAAIDEQTAKNWQPRVIVLGPQNAIVNERGI